MIIVLVLLALLIAVLLIVVVLLVNRSLQSSRANSQDDLSAAVRQLTEQNDSHSAETVARVVSAASESLASQLDSGQRELELRTQSFDKQLHGVVETLEKKLGSVDEIVGHRVKGVETTVGERVGGMSKLMDEQVRAMASELGQVKQLVATLQKDRANQHGQLVERLESTARTQETLAETTGQLRQALASPKTRGQWGERMAEDVLRSAGLEEGINYRKQSQLPGGTTPDFSFVLPHDQLLHMDVKFPIDNYLRYLDSETDDQRRVSQKAFSRDVRDRIKELQGRSYADSDSTVGYLLLFIPNESVYGFLHEHDGDLLDHALGRGVVLCSPTTLFAVLGIVRQSMDNFMVERTSAEILRVLGSFDDEWARFTAAVDKVEKHLSTLNNSFGEVAGPRRRQLQKQIDHVADLRGRSNVDSIEPAAPSAEVDDSVLLASPTLRDVTHIATG